MIYPFMTLEDDTKITHSEMQENGEIKVYVETPDEKDCFHSMICYLTDYRVEKLEWYSEEVEKILILFTRLRILSLNFLKKVDLTMPKLFEIGCLIFQIIH